MLFLFPGDFWVSCHEFLVLENLHLLHLLLLNIFIGNCLRESKKKIMKYGRNASVFSDEAFKYSFVSVSALNTFKSLQI